MGPVMILLSCPANWWWERSPNGSNSNNFCNVNSNGNANNNNANNTAFASDSIRNQVRRSKRETAEISTFMEG